ncbi:MAG TPA: hypothetical protein VFX16_22515, partial [Pseudonocardiaceae bacterium]|nr:hypothetical protein [Pseudonocardiaceae bacterium]
MRIDRRVSPNQTALWTVYELVNLGTTWGPHAVRVPEQRAGDRTSNVIIKPHVTCGNRCSNVLGVKGSQVQILSSRRSKELVDVERKPRSAGFLYGSVDLDEVSIVVLM